MSQRLFLIVDHLVFVVVVVLLAVVVVVLAFVVGAAAAEFDVVISVDVAAVATDVAVGVVK